MKRDELQESLKYTKDTNERNNKQISTQLDMARSSLKFSQEKLYKINQQYEKLVEKFQKNEKKLKGTIKERDSLKLKTIVLINKSKTVGVATNIEEHTKTCKVCNQEYTEKTNLNWSCRTHMSAWGGTMWWCCGKKDINQPGCKFQKHIDKNDENGRGDGEDEDEAANG